MKVCTNKDCEHKEKLQTLSNFYKHNKNLDGFQYWCKDCQKKQSKKRNEEKPKMCKESKRKWFKEKYKKLDFREKRKKQNRKWYGNKNKE